MTDYEEVYLVLYAALLPSLFLFFLTFITRKFWIQKQGLSNWVSVVWILWGIWFLYLEQKFVLHWYMYGPARNLLNLINVILIGMGGISIFGRIVKKYLSPTKTLLAGVGLFTLLLYAIKNDILDIVHNWPQKPISNLDGEISIPKPPSIDPINIDNWGLFFYVLAIYAVPSFIIFYGLEYYLNLLFGKSRKRLLIEKGLFALWIIWVILSLMELSSF